MTAQTSFVAITDPEDVSEAVNVEPCVTFVFTAERIAELGGLQAMSRDDLYENLNDDGQAVASVGHDVDLDGDDTADAALAAQGWTVVGPWQWVAPTGLKAVTVARTTS